ncbi:Protein SABRE, partial [Coemansia sp. Benny D115]
MSLPIRVFLSRFGLDVRSFSGTSLSGILVTIKIRGSMEAIVRIDKVGIDVRTMRRLRVRARALWMSIRSRLYAGSRDTTAAAAAAAGGIPAPEERPEVPRQSTESMPPSIEPLAASPLASGPQSSSPLSKRLQIYARGLHVQLFVAGADKPEPSDDDPMWLGIDTKDSIPRTSTSTTSTSRPTTADARDRRSDDPVLDSEAQELAAKLARKMSAILRTYAYIASLFARWVDISVSDVSLVVVHSAEMARTGHGVTLHVSNIMLWAESARESHGEGDGEGVGWIPTDIKNSVRGIASWLLRVLKIKGPNSGQEDEPLVAVAAEAAATEATLAAAEASDMSASPEHASEPHTKTPMHHYQQQQPSAARIRRDRGHKYLSTVALEVNEIRLFPGIEGAQQHINSRWELVKMLVMQDMLASKATSDSDKPHNRGPVVNCQRCTVRNDVITTFWGLPKKVDQSIEFGQTHIRAGIIDPLLDELAIMVLAPDSRSSDMSLRRLRALNTHLANVLRQYDGASAGDSILPSTSDDAMDADEADTNLSQPGPSFTEKADTSATSSNAKTTPAAAVSEEKSKGDTAKHGSKTTAAESTDEMDAEEARDQVHRMIFQLHEILSKLRLEHVSIALRVVELVFDLPLTPDTRSLVVKAPGMLRWRQRNFEIEAGYMWSAISSASPSTVNALRLSAVNEKDSDSAETSYVWPGDSGGSAFGRNFDGHVSRRSKDSTAFVRVSTGSVQATALRTPSMTPDPRAEELVPEAAGFRLRFCTLFGEMSAFLSEDLTHRPSPQPVFTVEVGRPELALDLPTQLAIDEARTWSKHIVRRSKAMRRIFAQGSVDSAPLKEPQVDQPRFVLSHRMHALVSLMFAEVKAHVTLERAVYSVRPHVPLPSVGLANSANMGEDAINARECIALRLHHVECHLLWNLAGTEQSAHKSEAGSGHGSDDSSDSGCDSSDDDGLPQEAHSAGVFTGPENSPSSYAESPRIAKRLKDALAPTIQFRLSTSPIAAQWESSKHSADPASEKRQLLVLKRGVRAHGTISMLIGSLASELAQMPRVNAHIEVDLGDMCGMLREYDFRHWLSMQPLWITTQLTRMAGMAYKAAAAAAAAPGAATGAGSPAASTTTTTTTATAATDPYHLDPVEERRRVLAATINMLFDSVRVTVMASDNEEDLLGGIEHGMQTCLSSGIATLRVNGGSIESPHAFGFRPDVGRLTLNLECQQATMYLLSAVSPQSARPEVVAQQSRLPKGFAHADLCGYLADSVQQHIVLVRPRLNYSTRRLEPYRSRTIYDLQTTSFAAITGVASVYRWTVFMHHIKYWSRRKKLARRMATQTVPPSPPDDILITINSELLDIQGDLVMPVFFNLDVGLEQCVKNSTADSASARQCPQMKLKMPRVKFTIEKTSQGTDNDMVIGLSGPLMTMYGASTPKGQCTRMGMQPLMSLKECQVNMRFPRKAKKQRLGAEQGVRSNSSYSKVDVVFERGAMAFGHRYNMAETIDGYILLQKGCKRIARKSLATCYPQLPFPESALERKPTAKMVIAALGNPRTFLPPPLRSLSGMKAPAPPTLAEADDIPTIDFHGPEFSIMIHDDPFETALSRIYQTGLHEQRERLSRLEAFETKAKELRSRREQEFLQTSASQRSRRSQPSKASNSAKSGRRQKHQRPSQQAQKNGGRMMKGASTFTSGVLDRGTAGQPLHSQSTGMRRPMLAGARTFTSSHSNGHSGDLPPPGLRGIASASMQDVTTPLPLDSAVSGGQQSRVRSYTTMSSDNNVNPSLLRRMGSGTGTIGSNDADGTTEQREYADEHDGDEHYEDVEDYTPEAAMSQHQRMLESIEAEISAAHDRLMLVESREWVKAIRRKMMPPPHSSECSAVGSVDDDVDDMHFGEIFDMPSSTSTSHREQECGSPEAKLPYNFVPASWTHPSAALGRLVMSPMWMRLDTPLSLLEFDQIEKYLRYLDPSTPYNLKWSTLVPMHLRIKCGDIKMQLRDFPFPLFRVPDPYRPETAPNAQCTIASYEEFYGGVEISSSLIIAERIAQEMSLRSIYVPIGPRSCESGIDLPDVGWYLSKSLQFPRIFASMSIMMFSSPSDSRSNGGSVKSLQHSYLHQRLPPLPIMSAWGASYQPVISAMMQRLESATSKSADASPSLPWWDKLRSRMHLRCRMAVIDAPPYEASGQGQLRKRGPVPPSLGEAYLNVEPGLPSASGQSNAPGGHSSTSVEGTSERGQMFFLALDGRDPYQVTQKPGSYLFTMRGGVRICINEGFPGSELWDKESGSGIYSVPTENAVPLSNSLSEFMQLRCEEFLMGVPIIIDRQSAILKSMDYQQPTETELTPSLEDIARLAELEVASASAGASNSGPMTWKKAYVELLQSISSDNSARYTFVTQSVDRLYFKVMQHLLGGVRLGIGLSSYIPPDFTGVRHNHWEVQPIAPESAQAMRLLGVTDAYSGYRSSKLHTSISLLCPFVDKESNSCSEPAEAEPAPRRTFVELYLTSELDSKRAQSIKSDSLSASEAASAMATGTETEADSATAPKSSTAPCKLLHLRAPSSNILSKAPGKWTAYDTDALVSPMHSLFSKVHRKQPPGGETRSEARKAKAQDLFFVPFPPTYTRPLSESNPAEFAANARPATSGFQASSAKPQCRISASAAVIESIQRYLPLYVSRMMLPVRKGKLYPFTETSDNKLGKCLRSIRLVLDLKNVELSYSQRDFEIKELETRETDLMGYKDDTPTVDAGLSPTPSDISAGTMQNVPGAKVEGTVRELKARVDSFSFNLLLEQASVKLHVGPTKTGEPILASGSNSASNIPLAAKKQPTRPRSNSGDIPIAASTSGSNANSKARKKTDKGRAHTATAMNMPPAETKALRWGVGDASTEIDYLDVRITHMSFIMPLFANPLACEALGKTRRVNGLKFLDEALCGLSEYEQGWISCDSIRDLKELDISEAIFTNPSVVCVLWSPRMVYFTQRPGWTQFGDSLDDILDGSPSNMPLASDVVQDTTNLNQKMSDMRPNVPTSLDSALASMPTSMGYTEAVGRGGHANVPIYRSNSAQRGRALSEVKHSNRFVRPSTSGNRDGLPLKDDSGSGNEDSNAEAAALHRRNTSMPWMLSRNHSHDGTAHDGPPGSRPNQQAPVQVHPPPQYSFFGNIQPAVTAMQRASTQPNVSSLWQSMQSQQQRQQQNRQSSEAGSTGPSPSLQPQAGSPYPLPIDNAGTESTMDTKSPSSAMSYKSSFHLLELARSRQRRLTASNSRQSMNPNLVAPAHSQHIASDVPFGDSTTVDLHRQPSIAVEPSQTSMQMARMVPTGPDPNVIMRDSRSTQAMLLSKRKVMLGDAILHEQASLAHLSREFERASSKHSEEFRREMIRRAEHIYELGARRKLINRCLRVLGVDPDTVDPEHLGKVSEPAENDVDFDRDTQEVEKVLATLYRHRCLIYSGYLIWTTQVRDKLMRFLYIQDCLTAIEYYLSETATKVARTATSAKGEDANRDYNESMSDTRRRGRSATTSTRNRADSAATAGSKSATSGHRVPGSTQPGQRDQPTRARRGSSDRRSVASGSSKHTMLNLPNILRRLRSHDKLDGNGSKDTEEPTGLGFFFKSKTSKHKQQSQKDRKQSQRQHHHHHHHHHQHEHRANKKGQKTRERHKEDYRLSKRSVGSNKFEKGLKNIWDDFVRYRPYYSILVEFLNSQVSLRVDEKTSMTSAIAVAERVQLHRILLCNETNIADEIMLVGGGLGSPDHAFVNPPDDESIVKTRSLVELENVQVFTARRDDFVNQAPYFVDCTYGSQMSGDLSQPSTIWPAWIPIELLLSQGKYRARGIFDELAEFDPANERRGSQDNDAADKGESDSDSDGAGFAPGGRSGMARSKYSKAWWLEDLSKYKRLMDRNNGLVVYDKANPHRIQGDSAVSIGDVDTVSGAMTTSTGADADADADATATATAGPDGTRLSGGTQNHASNERGKATVDDFDDEDNCECDDAEISDTDSCSSIESTDQNADDVANDVSGGGGQNLSHRANHFSIFLPELNLACTAEQYMAVYETVTELLVFTDPEKAAYMDHLNTILLGMDMDDLRGLLAVINATQEALRERLPIIQDWYAIQRSHVVLLRDAGRAMAADMDAQRQKSRAMSLLTLDRHRRALELQLRTAMDLFGTAQKQMRQQHRLDKHTSGRGGVLSVDAEDITRQTGKSAEADPSTGGTSSGVHNIRSRPRANTNKSTGSGLHPPVSGGRKRGVSMASLSSVSSSSGMQSIESAQAAIARTIHLYISKATWHMLENDGQPLCDVTLRWATLKAVTTSDQATHMLSEVHLLYIVNRLPNPMFTDLVGPYVRPKHPRPDFCVEKMIRVRWSELAPVGGISIVERFEVDLFPLRLQLSHDIGQKLINYLYPPQDATASATGFGGSNSGSRVDLALSSSTGRNRRPTMSSIGSAEGIVGSSSPQSMSMSPIPGTPIPASAPVSASQGGASPGAPIDSHHAGRSLLANQVTRRNMVEENLRGSPGANDRHGRSLMQMTQLSPQSASVGLLATMSGRSTPFSLFSENNSMINISQSSENRDQVDQMKKRASSNKTFLNIKIGGSTLCISYQGKKASNITDLRDFEFHAPRLELRNQVESYYELLMQVKKEYMSVVVQHTGALVKEKFRQLHNRKAWSKTSFGPDWEARRLLIDMDRRVEEDMAASLQGSMSERDESTDAIPVPELLVDSSATHEPNTRQPSHAASVASSHSASNRPDERTANTDHDDSASIYSTTSKAPLSKYMILDPRKLMGKRLPNVLPRNLVRSNEAVLGEQSHGGAEHPSVSPTTVQFVQLKHGSGSSPPASSALSSAMAPLYSARHADMLSLGSHPLPPRKSERSQSLTTDTTPQG